MSIPIVDDWPDIRGLLAAFLNAVGHTDFLAGVSLVTGNTEVQSKDFYRIYTPY